MSNELRARMAAIKAASAKSAPEAPPAVETPPPAPEDKAAADADFVKNFMNREDLKRLNFPWRVIQHRYFKSKRKVAFHEDQGNAILLLPALAESRYAFDMRAVDDVVEARLAALLADRVGHNQFERGNAQVARCRRVIAEIGLETFGPSAERVHGFYPASAALPSLDDVWQASLEGRTHLPGCGVEALLTWMQQRRDFETALVDSWQVVQSSEFNYGRQASLYCMHALGRALCAIGGARSNFHRKDGGPQPNDFPGIVARVLDVTLNHEQE